MGILNLHLGLSYEVIEYLVYSEFLLIGLIIITTYVLGLWSIHRKRKKKADQQALFQFIRLRMAEKATTFEFEPIINFSAKHAKDSSHLYCPHNLKDIEILLPVFIKIDKVCKFNEDWLVLRVDIVKRYLLAYAREHAKSTIWIKRLYSAEIFSFMPSNEDEDLIKNLVEDPIHIVYLHAIQAALMCNTEVTVRAVISRASRMNWLTQLMYLEPFAHAHSQKQTVEIVHDILGTTENDMVRAICYRVLTALPPILKIWYGDQYLHSSVLPLRLSALKYYVHIKAQGAIPKLTELLRDAHWQVRLISVHRLGLLHAVELSKELSICLSDSDWWVKTLTAHVMKKFGQEGYDLVKEIDPELIDIDFNVEEHLKYTLW